MSTSPTSNVRVLVRCRPQLPHEKGKADIIVADDVRQQIRVKYSERSDKVFDFDRVLGTSATQSDVYDEVDPLIDHVIDGMHATVFAYGQTGSGKTFTMDGFGYQFGESGQVQLQAAGASDRDGVIPRTVVSLFERVRAASAERSRTFRIQVSFMQLYNEAVFDLLNTSGPIASVHRRGGLKIRCNKSGHFFVQGLYLFECETAEEVLSLLKLGAKRKAMGSHGMNLTSSRSHTLFTLHVTSWESDDPDGAVNGTLRSDFALVDLAGSEKLGLMSANPSAKLLQESVDINVSLLALGKVISALSKQNGGGARVHVPYRESKLTKLLRHSLGGDAKTCMIACVAPCEEWLDESMSTLFYAGRARNIRNMPRINEDPRTGIIRRLKEENVELKTELERLNGLVLSLQLDGSGAKGGKPVVAGSSEESQYLGEKLLQSVGLLTSIVESSGRLRAAFDRLLEAKEASDRELHDCDSENLVLRERIDVLESLLEERNEENQQAREDKASNGGGGRGGVFTIMNTTRNSPPTVPPALGDTANRSAAHSAAQPSSEMHSSRAERVNTTGGGGVRGNSNTARGLVPSSHSRSNSSTKKPPVRPSAETKGRQGSTTAAKRSGSSHQGRCNQETYSSTYGLSEQQRANHNERVAAYWRENKELYEALHKESSRSEEVLSHNLAKLKELQNQRYGFPSAPTPSIAVSHMPVSSTKLPPTSAAPPAVILPPSTYTSQPVRVVPASGPPSASISPSISPSSDASRYSGGHAVPSTTATSGPPDVRPQISLPSTSPHSTTSIQPVSTAISYTRSVHVLPTATPQTQPAALPTPANTFNPIFQTTSSSTGEELGTGFLTLDEYKQHFSPEQLEILRRRRKQ